MMNKQAYFKLVNAIANVLEGDKIARLKMAHDIVRRKALNEVDQLIDFTTLQPKVFVTTEMPKKERYKKTDNKTPRLPKTKPSIDEESPITDTQIPANIAEIFSIEEAETIQSFVNRFAEQANKMAGKHLYQQKLIFAHGMDKLAKVGDFNSLQFVMVSSFLMPYAKKVIRKFLDMGIGYKTMNKVANGTTAINTNTGKLEINSNEAKNGYQQSSSNRGNITAFEVDEILHDLIYDASRLTFDENMFETPANTMGAIFYRISNVIQVRMRELRNQTKVVTAKKQFVQEESASRSTEEEALALAEELGCFTNDEMRIITMRIQGFQKKEIDQAMGKRTDRDFSRIEKKYTTEQVSA